MAKHQRKIRQIDLPAAEIARLAEEKRSLVEREAWRFKKRCFVETGVLDINDIMQEAWLGFMVTLECFVRHQRPLERMDAYLCLGIQGELTNWILRMKRQFDYKYDVPEDIENVPEVVQDLMPCMDDLEIVGELSRDALDFLTAIMIPSPALSRAIKVRVMSNKPYSRSILPELMKFLGISYDQYNAIKLELREKVVYEPLKCMVV